MDDDRLRELFRECLRRGLAKNCEADRLWFLAACARALRIEKVHPCRMFAAQINRGDRRRIDDLDEQAARERLARMRGDEPLCRKREDEPEEIFA